MSKTTTKKIDNTDRLFGYGIDVQNRIIHISSDIDSELTSLIISGLQMMMVSNREKDIHIYINSYGGCPYSSIGLYSFIRTLKSCTVKTYNIGCAMSGASIIFLAGDQRYMYKETVFMLHSVSSGAEGKVHLDLVDEAEECKKIHTTLCEIYAENTTQNKKFWDRTIKFKDRYYREKDALRLGLVQEVIEVAFK